MNAYEGTMTKTATLKQLRAHKKADEIVQGAYWNDGKGCAVGCLTHDPLGGHNKFPAMWGIPVKLAYLIDTLFESLSVEDSKEWPLRIMSAIPKGANLDKAWDKWQLWCLRDLVPIAGVNAAVVERMAYLFERAVGDDEPSETEWREAAWAARDAWAAWAPRDAWAAWAARAAWDARATRDARDAWDARATRAPRDARDARATRHEWAIRACDALVQIVSES